MGSGAGQSLSLYPAPLDRADRPTGTMGLMTSQRSLWPWTTRVTMRHRTDEAHAEAAFPDLEKNDEPGETTVFTPSIAKCDAYCQMNPSD